MPWGDQIQWRWGERGKKVKGGNACVVITREGEKRILCVWSANVGGGNG